MWGLKPVWGLKAVWVLELRVRNWDFLHRLSGVEGQREFFKDRLEDSGSLS